MCVLKWYDDSRVFLSDSVGVSYRWICVSGRGKIRAYESCVFLIMYGKVCICSNCGTEICENMHGINVVVAHIFFMKSTLHFLSPCIYTCIFMRASLCKCVWIGSYVHVCVCVYGKSTGCGRSFTPLPEYKNPKDEKESCSKEASATPGASNRWVSGITACEGAQCVETGVQQIMCVVS